MFAGMSLQLQQICLVVLHQHCVLKRNHFSFPESYIRLDDVLLRGCTLKISLFTGPPQPALWYDEFEDVKSVFVCVYGCVCERARWRPHTSMR